MQRHLCTKPSSKDTEVEPVTLDAALSPSADEQLFYTASVHFLRKRLQEKAHRSSGAAREPSHSCCDFSLPPESQQSRINLQRKFSRTEIDCPKTEGPELPMHQVLPFPKSNNPGFFSRLKKTLRKCRQSFSLSDSSSEDTEDKCISNFKFPRCERPSRDAIAPSCLMLISEETSEALTTSTSRLVPPSSSKSDDCTKESLP